MRKKFLSFWTFPILAALVIGLFAGCGAAADSAPANKGVAYATTAATSFAVNYSFTTDTEMESANISASGSLFVPADQRKIIRNASMTVESEDYAASYSALQNKLLAAGGYIEQINTSGSAEYCNRYANITLRIPAQQLDFFLESRESFGSVQTLEIWQDDVTFNYTDMETRLETLRTKHDRLLAMLEKATEMSDIIELESALSDTIYEIERYTSNLRGLDDQISYSTVHIYLREVVEVKDIPATPKTLGEKIAARFEETLSDLGDFGEELLIFVIGVSPVLVLLGAIAVVIVLIFKKATQKNREKYNRYLAQYRKDIPAEDIKTTNTEGKDS